MGWGVLVQGVGSTGPDMAVSQSKEAIFQEKFSILMLMMITLNHCIGVERKGMLEWRFGQMFNFSDGGV